MHLKNPPYFRASKNYDVSLENTLIGTFSGCGEEILKRIAKNSTWYDTVIGCRREVNQNIG